MAENDKNNLDEFFKEKLQSHTSSPRPQAWQKLSAALQEEKKPTRKIPILWISSIAAALVLGLGIGTYWWQNSSTSSENANQFVIVEDNPKRDAANQEDNSINEEDANQKIMQENKNIQEGSKVAPNQEENLQKKGFARNIKTDDKKERKSNDKIKKEKNVLNELDKNAPIRLKDKEQPVLVENTQNKENQENKTGETMRITVKVRLTGGSNALQQAQVAQNDKKPKRRIDKVFKAIKDFKEGELPERDSLGFESERLWASIGKK